MVTLESTLTRLGASALAQLLGRSVVDLLDLLDERQAAPSRLAELLVREAGEEALLLTTRTRKEIVSALTKAQAVELAQAVGVDDTEPWDSLARLGFKRGQKRTELLFNFFGLPAPTPFDDPGEPSAVVEAGYPLFPHQQRAANRALQILSASANNRLLLHMPTGSGKTRTAMNLVSHFLRHRCHPDELFVWLAYSEELCAQAAEEFEKAWRFLGDRTVLLRRHFGPYRSDLGGTEGGALVAGLGLLYQDSLRNQSTFLALARRVRLVVFDEAHQATAPTFQHLLNLLASDARSAVLGLSATPGRAWIDAAQDLALADFFHRQKVTLEVEGYANPVEYLQDEGYLAKAEYVRLEVPGTNIDLSEKELEAIRLGFDLPESALKRVGSDSARNLLIVSRILAEWTPGRKILVFACSVEHARLLSAVLRLKGCPAACITAETVPQVRQHLIEEFRSGSDIDVLTNYGVLTTGFDAPKTSVAVIARPTRSVVLYSQMVGRAARGPRAGGNASCRIITLVDSIRGFRSIAEGFSYWNDIWPED
jgi:DNA repair protein RadD